MASLRKFPKSPYYFACFSMPDGRRAQRSTKETARKAAQAKADEWERLSKERAKARQAHRIIADIYRTAHAEELPDSTPRVFMNGWLARRKGEVSKATFSAYEGRTAHFLGWLGKNADRPLAELEARHFIDYRDNLAGRLSPATCNHAIRILRVVFEDARRDGYIAENPAKDCRMLKKSTGSTRRPFTVEELRAVLSVADEEWRSMILFGLYTGQRLRDIASFTWANIDPVSAEIHLRTSKTSRVVRIPICEPLRQHLDSLPAGDDPHTPVHPRSFGCLNGSTLSRQFGELLASAGLREKRSHEAAKDGRSTRRDASGLSFHSLRHTATSLMKNAGVSPAVVQDIIGHDSAEISAHYTHIDAEAKKRALGSLPNLLLHP